MTAQDQSPAPTPAHPALPADLVALLRRPSPCHIATLMPDGSHR